MAHALTKSAFSVFLILLGLLVALSVVPLFAEASTELPEYLTGNLSSGDQGEQVSLLQTWLASDPALYPEGLVNGKFGAATRKAVQRYQERKGMILKHLNGANSYGNVGPMTRANLNADFSKSRGGISSVESLYGDALVFSKGAFVPLSEKQFAANVPIVERLNVWVNPAALAEYGSLILENGSKFAVGVQDFGKLVAVSPKGRAVTTGQYAEGGKWQHLAVLFSEKDAVFIYDNKVVETVKLEKVRTPNIFEMLFSGVADRLRMLTRTASVSSESRLVERSPQPSYLRQRTQQAPALVAQKSEENIFERTFSFVGSFLGIQSDRPSFSAAGAPQPLASGSGSMSSGSSVAVNTGTSGGGSEFVPVPIPSPKPVSPIQPKTPPIIMPIVPLGPDRNSTTTVVTEVDTKISSTTALASGESATSTSTSTLANGSASSTDSLATGGGSSATVSGRPVITLSGSTEVSIGPGSFYTDPGASATDPEEGDITGRLVVGGDVINYQIPGSYRITYNVADVSGQSAIEIVRILTVTAPAPIPESQQVPHYTLAPAGQNVSLSMQSGQGQDPQFTNVTVDPLHVFVGDTQTFTVTASSASGVASVRAVTQLDTSTLTLDLVKQSDDGTTATFSTSWVVYDTHTEIYRTTFTATSGSGSTNSITTAWSDPCTGVTQGADSSLSADCAVSAIYGLDGGNLTIPAGRTLTLNAGATWAFNPGTSVRVDGVIAKGAGATIRKGYIFYSGATNDAADTLTILFGTAPTYSGAVPVDTYSQSNYYAQGYYYAQSNYYAQSSYYGQGYYQTYYQGGYCFAPETPILMYNGTRKAIKDIRIGDVVMGQNEKGERRRNIVTTLFRHTREANQMQDFDMLKVNGSLIVRAEHPMATERGWVKAGELKMGDVLVGVDTAVPVVSLEAGPSIPQVYNMTTFPDHTYFAGDVLVHNKISSECFSCPLP